MSRNPYPPETPNCMKIFCERGRRLIPTVVRDAPLDLIDGLIDELEGALAMAALVRGGAAQVGARGAQVPQRGLHRGLGSVELTGDESDGQDEEEKSGAENGTLHRYASFERMVGRLRDAIRLRGVSLFYAPQFLRRPECFVLV